ncbi:hypothetical protein ACLKA6_004987 [Drosophila palustris]
MFKLVVLSALLAVAVARPGHLYESPVVYAAPATTIVQENVLAKVGAVVKSVPSSVSHQSHSVVHSSAHVVEDVVAPVVKSYAAPVVSSYVAAASPFLSSYVAAPAPLVKTVATYAAPAPVLKTYATPVVYNAGW